MDALAGFCYREIVQRLKELGLVFHRQAASSHEIWFNPAQNRYTTIPNHSGDMPEATLRAVLAGGDRRQDLPVSVAFDLSDFCSTKCPLSSVTASSSA
jgi:predicted RNA binding protein YcfA (HicA-like mRNA interferase family)